MSRVETQRKNIANLRKGYLLLILKKKEKQGTKITKMTKVESNKLYSTDVKD